MQLSNKRTLPVWRWAVSGLLVLIVIQLSVLLGRRTPMVPALPEIDVPVGDTPRMVVHRAGISAREQLTQVGAGSCRLIIVYSPTCGASASAALRWHQDLSADSSDAVPKGWSSAWLSVEDSVASAGFFPAGFTQPRQYASRSRAVLEGLGIRAVPAYLILDREGTIVSGGLGAPLYRPEAYAADCTIRLTPESQ